MTDSSTTARPGFSCRTWCTVAGIVLAVVSVRMLWPLVASWREDEAAVVWISSHVPFIRWTEGLLSSTGLPNPNGMLFIAYPGTLLPNLYWTGVAYQCVQLVLLYYFVSGLRSTCPSVSPRWAFFILGSSYALGATGSEPFCQWMMTWVNLAFMGTLFRFNVRPSAEGLILMYVLVLISPALYIAGVLNSLLFLLFLAAAIWHRKDEALSVVRSPRTWLYLCLATATVAVLVWVPYFGNVSLEKLKLVEHRPFLHNIRYGVGSLLLFPYSILTHVNSPSFGGTHHSDPALIGTAWMDVVGWAQYLVWMVAVSAGLVLSLARKVWPAVVLWVFVALFLALSPLLGGPRFILGERQDIAIQILPLVVAALLVAFSRERRWHALLVVWGGLNLAAAALGVKGHLEYDGPLLTNADAPLHHKRQVVRWIADDWRKDHPATEPVPVSYDVAGGKFNWVPRHGALMPQHYRNPYTLGRGFDYSLEREFKLSNRQEGVQFRQSSQNGYVVGYTFEPQRGEARRAPSTSFGRFRVTAPVARSPVSAAHVTVDGTQTALGPMSQNRSISR